MNIGINIIIPYDIIMCQILAALEYILLRFRGKINIGLNLDLDHSGSEPFNFTPRNPCMILVSALPNLTGTHILSNYV